MLNRNSRHHFFGNDCAVRTKYEKMAENLEADGCLITSELSLRDFAGLLRSAIPVRVFLQVTGLISFLKRKMPLGQIAEKNDHRGSSHLGEYRVNMPDFHSNFQ